MSELFEDRAASPMLIGAQSEPFDDPDCLFELKLDGERCLAYLGGGVTELRNKRNNRLGPKFPELDGLHRQVSGRCILDGELTVLQGGKPSFSALLRRTLASGTGLRAQLRAQQAPANFTAFDILYLDGQTLTGLPLTERKALLAKTVAEGDRLALSRYIEGRGKAFFALAAEQELEGIVAKRKDSLYRMGRRTADWIKIKNLLDGDYVVCGWVPKSGGMTSVALGQYGGDGALHYKGHVTLGVSGAAFRRIREQPPAGCPFTKLPAGNEETVWLRPALVCTVSYMQKTASGGLRQPVFKGLRTDKRPEDCVE